MRPAEFKDLIKATKLSGKKSGNIPESKTSGKPPKTSTIDIRLEKWQKINDRWVNDSGWSPYDALSVKKVENWIEEITSLNPRKNRDVSHLNYHPDHTPEHLEGQLSAVEGHKKIEIEELKDSWVKPEIEEIKEDERLGQELEQEPWIDRAKTLVGILLASIVALYFIYVNKPAKPSLEERLFITQEFIKLENKNWSQPKRFPSIGSVYLYNSDWEKIDTPEGKLKGILLIIQDEYQQNTLETLKLSPKEELRRIKEIVDSDRPLLIYIPEGSDNIKLWISRTGSIIKERIENDELSWEFLKSKKINDIDFLKK
jgi:hypothetical protein